MGQIVNPLVSLPAGAFANPTALLGLAPQNGVSLKAMRSDASPGLDQAIAPLWTALHTFSKNGALGPDDSTVKLAANPPYFEMRNTGAAANGGRWILNLTSTNYQVFATDDAGAVANVGFRMVRAAGTANLTGVEFGNATNNPTFSFIGTGAVRLTSDSQELQIGASQDLRQFHNGTDSVIENDTGDLILRVNGELMLDEVTSSNAATGGAATALPALPVGYVSIGINGTLRKIAYYAT